MHIALSSNIIIHLANSDTSLVLAARIILQNFDNFRMVEDDCLACVYFIVSDFSKGEFLSEVK